MKKTHKPTVVHTARSAAAGEARAAAAPGRDSLPDTGSTEGFVEIPDYERLRASLAHIGLIRTLDEWSKHTRGNISDDHKITIVTETLKALEGLYVHRRLKNVLYAVDPFQELRLLAQRISNAPMDDRTFHEEMLRILKQLNDMHTAYRLPPPYRVSVAFLPFLLGQYYTTLDSGACESHYIVTRTLFDAYGPPHPWFKRGVEVLAWNGTPIERQADESARHEEGSNRDADRALGLQFMTVRWLAASYPPDATWVEVLYRDERGTERDIRLDWHVLTLHDDPAFKTREQFLWLLKEPEVPAQLTDAAVNIRSQIQHSSRWGLFRPDDVENEQDKAVQAQELGPKLHEVFDRYGKRAELQKFTKDHSLTAEKDGVPSLLPMFLQARHLPGEGRSFGYIRIRAFPLVGPARDLFVPEFRRLLSEMPPGGLIIDIRGNPGGSAINAESLLQLLSPNEIAPIDFQFAATDLTKDIVSRDPGERTFAEWKPSILVATQVGAEHSAGRALTSLLTANGVGQEYFGPVLLITDAMSYSAADIFAAGFEDNGVGRILGVDESTGAGGSNVWFHREAVRNKWLRGPNLPAGVDLQLSARRCVRVKKNSGLVLEDFGVKNSEGGKLRHRLTRDDLLCEGRDLLANAVSILGQQPERDLEVSLLLEGKHATVKVTCEGMDQLDFYLNDRPETSVPVGKDGLVERTFGPFDTGTAHVLEIIAFSSANGLPIRVAWYKQLIAFDQFLRGT